MKPERELFIQSIEAIEKQMAHDKNCSVAFEFIFPDVGPAYYYNSILQEQLIEVLKKIMNDEEEWIDYFIWELEFGKKWKKDSVLINDVPVQLKTAEDLYNVLNYEKGVEDNLNKVTIN